MRLSLESGRTENSVEHKLFIEVTCDFFFLAVPIHTGSLPLQRSCWRSDTAFPLPHGLCSVHCCSYYSDPFAFLNLLYSHLVSLSDQEHFLVLGYSACPRSHSHSYV